MVDHLVPETPPTGVTARHAPASYPPVPDHVPPPGPHERVEHLREVIETIALMTRDFAASGSHPFKGRKLGRSQMTMLWLLSRSDGWSIGALADAMGVTSGAVSQAVDILRSEDLVTSSVDPADSRRRTIRLTDIARDEVDAFQNEYISGLTSHFDSLSTAEVTQLNALLSRVRPHVEKGAP